MIDHRLKVDLNLDSTTYTTSRREIVIVIYQ